MEEKKCCENGECSKCTDKKACCGSKCHGHCHLFKILIPIIIIAAAFYAGTIAGSRGDYRGHGENQRYMEKGFDTSRRIYNSATGEATITVQPNTEVAPTTVPPTVKQ